MKIIINKCYGGFSLSQEAILWLIKNKGWKTALDDSNDDSIKITEWTKKDDIKCFGRYSASEYRIDRTDKDLVECVEVLGNEANGRYANLKIIEIPDGIEYEIDEYDGVESIAEKHRSWG
ncbi:MAG: hypothetical protein AABY07_00535 [Nanoarchaeota archaeon]